MNPAMRKKRLWLPYMISFKIFYIIPPSSPSFNRFRQIFHTATPSVIPTSRVLSLLTRLASYAVHLRDLRRRVSEQVCDLLRREAEERSVRLLDSVYKF